MSKALTSGAEFNEGPNRIVKTNNIVNIFKVNTIIL